MKLTPLAAELLRAENYRDFLRAHFTASKGYASFARRAGFSSRSYPRDVANGTKRITAASLPRFIQALGLKGELKSYFTLLVMLEEDTLNAAQISRARIEEKLAKLRRHLEMAAQGPLITRQADRVFGREHWPEIYAALGTPEKGASAAEVAARTGIPLPGCEAALSAMVQCGLVDPDEAGHRFLAKRSQLIFERLGSKNSYQGYFHRSMTGLLAGAHQDFEAGDRLYFSSAVSVRRQDLPRLKEELREVLVRFADRAEIADGDCIARVCAGMAPMTELKNSGS